MCKRCSQYEQKLVQIERPHSLFHAGHVLFRLSQA